MSVNDSNVVDVGTPPQNLSSNKWGEMKVVRFHGYANLLRPGQPGPNIKMLKQW